MSEDRRKDAATAGSATPGSGPRAVMRDRALRAAYEGARASARRSGPSGSSGASRAAGKLYAAGAGLGALSATPALYGTTRLLSPAQHLEA